jgi:hypothetical protein
MNTPSQNPEVLHSWKEIATYLGCGIRTVQRYELNLRLPVRRVAGRSKSSVLALKSDLNTWLQNSHIRSAERVTGVHSEPSIFENWGENSRMLGHNGNKISRASIALDAHQQVVCKLDRNIRKLLEQFAESQRIRSQRQWFSKVA